MTLWKLEKVAEKISVLRSAVRSMRGHGDGGDGDGGDGNGDGGGDDSNLHHLELGGYIGYSALCVASLPIVKSVTSVEHNPINVAIAKFIIDHVSSKNIQSKIEFHLGTIESMKTISIKRMTSILLDHWKDEYLISLKILESRDMLEERAVVINLCMGTFLRT